MKFRVILADPPWPFRDQGSRASPNYAGQGRAQAHYQVQSLDDILAMGALVKELTHEDSFLFLWAPNVIVLDGTATAVARTWGFEPKQIIPWIKTDKKGKPRMGSGHYTRVCSEMLILCRRGKAVVRRHDIPGVIIAPRGRHSAKPDRQYDLIERLCKGPFIELYARKARERWVAWGNQIKETRAA